MATPNKFEMGILKWFIARLKSKSPKEYEMLVKACTVLSAIMAAYIGFYTQTPIIPHAGIWEKLNAIFVTAGAVLTATGIIAATTTTDPALTQRKLSADTSDRGNDTNG